MLQEGLSSNPYMSMRLDFGLFFMEWSHIFLQDFVNRFAVCLLHLSGVTNSVRFILGNHFGQEVINYLHDFAGCEMIHNTASAYARLRSILKEYDLEESVEKALPPSTKIGFLGVLFNTYSISSERLEEITDLVKIWL